MGVPRNLGVLAAIALIVAIAMPCGAAPTQKQAGERRVALVVGNGKYVAAPQLANPGNDARLIAATLAGLGFELVGGGALIDLDKANLELAIRRFGEKLAGAGVGLFYYAGHGIQLRGANYLIPVSARLDREADVKYELVDASFVLDEMGNAGTRLNMMVLDACRNNPFAGRGWRSIQSGLAQMQAPGGTIIGYATQPGAVAQDGAGANGPYASALAAAMKKPGLSVLETFNEAGVQVQKATGGQQQPWIATSPLEGRFAFAAASAAAPAARPAVAPAAATPAAAAGPAAGPAASPASSASTAAAATLAAVAPSAMGPVHVGPGRRAAVGDLDRLPLDGAKAVAGYKDFLAQKLPRAFAVAVNGHWSWRSGQDAADRALEGCSRLARIQCQLYAVDDRVVMPVFPEKAVFFDEWTDFGLAAPTREFRKAELGAATPLSVPGAKTIKTAELHAALQRADRPILIDVLDLANHRVLPSATWLKNAGNTVGTSTAAQGRFAKAVDRLAGGDKERSVAVYCLSAWCWESYNAALQLVRSGYRNVLWYRGGVRSWIAAGLPVETREPTDW